MKLPRPTSANPYLYENVGAAGKRRALPELGVTIETYRPPDEIPCGQLCLLHDIHSIPCQAKRDEVRECVRDLRDVAAELVVRL